MAFVRELPNEPSRGTSGDPRHRNQDAVGALPEFVTLKPLEHASGLDREDELCVGFEGELFD